MHQMLIRRNMDIFNPQQSRWAKIKKNKLLYLMFLPVVVYYLIFHYAPMFGIVIAFKDYNAFTGFIRSPWVGLKHFKDFFLHHIAGGLLETRF